MVNRKNYTKVKAFLDYLKEVAQLKSISVSRYGALLKHLLVWADEYTLAEAHMIRPSFPSYLAKTRLDGRVGSLAPATAKKCVQVAKRFLTWSKLTYPNEFRDLSQLWIDSLRAPRTCLLFLSGMRAGALISLPLKALDVEARTVHQWPSLGVRTKMGKSATTYLLEIPELIKPVMDWDRYVRSNLPDTAMWYTPTVNYWGDQKLSASPPGSSRVVTLGKRMRKLFAIAQLPYKSPHKFRHGHAVFSLLTTNQSA